MHGNPDRSDAVRNILQMKQMDLERVEWGGLQAVARALESSEDLYDMYRSDDMVGAVTYISEDTLVQMPVDQQ